MKTSFFPRKRYLFQFTWKSLIRTLIALICALPSTSGASAAIVRHEIIQGMPEFSDVQDDWSISPDGSYVVFKADLSYDGILNLYSVPIRGGVPVQLNDPYVYGGEIYQYSISPDSQYVVFLGDLVVDERRELFCVSITGGDQLKLNSTLVNHGNVRSFRIMPDSQGVVYYADQREVEKFELFSVSISGGTPINLSLHVPVEYLGVYYDYEITPDSLAVVFQAELSIPIFDTFIVSISGGSVQKLNNTGEGRFGFDVTPDGENLVYWAYQSASDAENLYAVPISGGASHQLNPELVSGGQISFFVISPNGKRVVFYAETAVLGQDNLYSVLMDGTGLVKLNETLLPGDEIHGFEITPNSQGVVYKVYNAAQHTDDLYSIYINGNLRTLLNPYMGSGEDINYFKITPNSLGVVYTADQDLDEVIELFSVYINGENPTKLNPDFNPWQNIEYGGFQISPNSLGVVYKADLEKDDQYELYAVPTVGGESEKVNGVYYGMIFRYLITPDSQAVIYQTRNAKGQGVLFYATNGTLVYLPVVSR